LAKYIKGENGKFAGSIGDGKDRVPTAGAPTTVVGPEADELEPHDVEMVKGLLRNVATSARGNKLVAPSDVHPSDLPEIDGLNISQVSLGNVYLENGKKYNMPVGAIGTWNNYPFVIGPGGDGYAVTLAIYPVGTNPISTSSQPLTAVSTLWGGGLGDIASDLHDPLLTSMFDLTSRRLWHHRPDLAEQFPVPGVERPTPSNKRGFLGLFRR
jgi:hypothetical protein